jgi:hypothetical protein
MFDLWNSRDLASWRAALEQYPAVVAAQGVPRLAERDQWYRGELSRALAGRSAAYATLDELVQVTEWKMARGVWRQRNLILVRSNQSSTVEDRSRAAFALVPDPTKPIAILSDLAGVGPATASALLAAFAPGTYPFFDDLVAGQVPALGKVDFTPRFYARYADALRERASQLGLDWTPTLVERALWANAGGKAGVRSLSEAG